MIVGAQSRLASRDPSNERVFVDPALFNAQRETAPPTPVTPSINLPPSVAMNGASPLNGKATIAVPSLRVLSASPAVSDGDSTEGAK